MATYVSSTDLPAVFEVTDAGVDETQRAIAKAMGTGLVGAMSGGGEALIVNWGRLVTVRVSADEPGPGVDKWTGELAQVAGTTR